MEISFILCALVVLYDARVSSDAIESRLVTTTNGPVRGYRDTNSGLFMFYGIPYAVAPTGENRFKAPLPAPVWTEPLDAVDSGIVCPQLNLLTTGKTMKEDCLIANVYVPETNKTNLPVLVIIHGGGYIVGYGELKTVKHLVKNKEIIAVTFNYRLGAHGFLCLGTEGAPGNAGMKDQVALLRWMQKNIRSFGGNPDDVTIDGYSAGSSAVDLLILSKAAKGLFNKAIPESGANLAVWSVQLDPVKNAQDYAKMLNFDNVEDIHALENFYRTSPIESLIINELIDEPNSRVFFSPCVERDIGVEVFLDDSPFNILKTGNYIKVPMLYGFTNMEGLVRIPWFNQWKNGMNEKFSDFLPADLHFDTEDQKEEVAMAVKQFYFNNSPVSEDLILGYINYYTDVMFAYPTLRSLKLQVEAGNSNIYLYEYSFMREGTMDFYLPIKINARGAEHGAQTTAVEDGIIWNDPDESNITEDYMNVKTVMREIWINFITKAVPVPVGSSLPVWPPAGADCSPHMSLDSSLELRGRLLPERMRLWDGIYKRHYRAPIPPPTLPPRSSTEL